MAEEDDVEKLFWQEAKKSNQSSTLLQVHPLPGVPNQPNFRRHSVAVNTKLRMKKVQSELLGMTDLNGIRSRLPGAKDLSGQAIKDKSHEELQVRTTKHNRRSSQDMTPKEPLSEKQLEEKKRMNRKKFLAKN